MFFVFNKNKIYSYLIAVCTVVMLFFIASIISNDELNTVETSSKVIENEANINENIFNENETNIINEIEIIFDKKAK